MSEQVVFRLTQSAALLKDGGGEEKDPGDGTEAEGERRQI